MLSNLEPTADSTLDRGAVPRRVAMVVRLFSPHGGLELYTHKLVEGLLERGIAVTVLCEENQSDLVHPSLSVKFFEAAGRSAKKFEKIAHYYNAATEALADLTDCQIVHSQHLPVKGADVVTFHNHTVFRLTEVGLPWEAALNRVKAGLVPSYRLREKHDRELIENASCRVFSSRTCLDDFYRTYGERCAHDYASYMVAYPGAALSQSRALAQPQVLESAPRSKADSHEAKPFNFLFVGKGYRKKGLDVLLAACTILNKRGRRFNLLIAGLNAKPVDKLRLLLLGLNCVHYLGFQKDMLSVYEKSAALVLPSRIEPFGMAPLQGMLNGLPPVVSRVSGIAELLEHGNNALILDNHLNAAELANLMESLMMDEELRRRLAQNGRELARALSWDATVESTVEAYQYALSKRKGKVTST